MSPYILTSSPAGFSSSALTGTAPPTHDSLRLAFPTTSSEAHLQTPGVPTHASASIYLQREWVLPVGCDFPGVSFFSSEFVNSKSFPTSLFSGHWDASASGCTWVYTSSLTSTSTSSLPSSTSVSATPARSGLRTNAIIGIAVSTGVATILLTTGLVFSVMRRRHRRHALSESDSVSASGSLIPVAYLIPRWHGSRGTSPYGVSSPLQREFHGDLVSEGITVGAGVEESMSLTNCSLVPRLSVSSPLPGSIVFSGPAPLDPPCRTEKALMQLRDMDRRPQVMACEVAPPPTDAHGGDMAPETHQAGDVKAGSYGTEGGVPSAECQEADVRGIVDDFCDIGAGHFLDFDPLDSDSDSDSRTTLPPPYSSHPSLREHAV